MKTMLMFDLLSAKKILLTPILLAVVVALFMSAFISLPIIVMPMVTVMIAYSSGLTLVAFDERNDWEKLRLTMPLSRANIICGRYATIAVITLIGLCIGLVLATLLYALDQLIPTLPFLSGFAGGIEWQVAVAMFVAAICSSLALWLIVLPIVSRFGTTKAVRFIPLAFVVFIPLGTSLAQTAEGAPAFIMNIVNWVITPAGTISFALIIITVIAVLYALSCLLSVKLYENREF